MPFIFINRGVMPDTGIYVSLLTKVLNKVVNIQVHKETAARMYGLR